MIYLDFRVCCNRLTDESMVKQAIELAQSVERPDLELKILENHRSNQQSLSKGYGPFDSDNLDQRIQELKNILNSN